MTTGTMLVPESDYGPAMQALPNDRWREFVRIYCGNGRRNATEAYRLAFVRSREMSRETAAVGGSRLLHDERTQAAILEYCQKALRTLAPLAVQVMEDVATNEQAAPSDRLTAAKMIADRTGLHAVAEQKHTVRHVNDPDQIKRISAMAELLGLPIEKLLGQRLAEKAPKVIDVTPEPVEDDPFADEEY